MAFDFKQITPLSATQLAAAQTAFYTFSAQAAYILTDLLQTPADINLNTVSQLPFSKLKRQFQYPVCCAKLALNYSDDPALMLLSGSMAYASVDRMLGGKGHLPLHAQNFSNLERAVLRKLTGSLLKQLELTFKHLYKLKFSIDEILAETTEISGVTPYSPFIVANFSISIDNLQGNLVLALPSSALKNFPEQPVNPDSYSRGLNPDGIEFELKALLGSLALLPQDISQLRPGDVIALDQHAEAPIDITLDDEPILKGVPGLFKEHKGVQIL